MAFYDSRQHSYALLGKNIG